MGSVEERTNIQRKAAALRWSLFLACSFIKTRPHNSCFPVTASEAFVRIAPSFQEHYWLLPTLVISELPLVKSLIFTKAGLPLWKAITAFPHEKINRCLTDINRCLTDIFKI